MNKRVLITTPLKQTWKTERPFTLLGKWCLTNSYHSDDIYDIEPYHWDSRTQLYRDYIYLSSLYENILVDISHSLNNIHGVDHCARYWRILIGPWLGYIIQILYDRWKSIENAASKSGKYETTVLKYDYDLFIPNDMSSFSLVFNDDIWNHYIYGKILKEFPAISVHEEDVAYDLKYLNEHVQKTHIDKKNTVLKYIEGVLSPLVRTDDNFLIATYLPYWEQVKLQVALGQFPVIYSTKEERIVFPPNEESRRWSIESVNKNAGETAPFEKWLRSIIPSQIPTSYMEGYKQHVQRANELHWPASPKVIWTSNLFHGHDLFKIWAADKVEQGARLIIGQHGGNFGMAKWNSSEDHQVDISDVYFSWGWTDTKRPKIYPVGQLKMIRDKGKHSPDKQQAMLVTVELPRYSYFMMSAPVAGQWLDYQQDQYDFIGSLTPKIKSKFIVRLKSRKNGWQSYDRWRHMYPDLQIDVGRSNFHKEIAKSKLVVSTYNAATYLESMAMNIPTVMFWNPSYWELRDDASDSMQELEGVGIFHSTPESAARHVERIWDDVYGWWESESVQRIKDRFCHKYSNIPENMIGNIRDVINKTA